MVDIHMILQKGKVIPILTFRNVEKGFATCQALYEGGIKVFEITLRTNVGLRVIERMAASTPDAMIGAGTITIPEQCRIVRDAGANFGVCPGISTLIHKAAHEAHLPLLPGVMTPTDILKAINLGYRALKFFPAVLAGGVPMLQAFHGPFPDLTFCPTGGIDAVNIHDFLSLPNVSCVGGSWISPKHLVEKENWNQITQMAKTVISNSLD